VPDPETKINSLDWFMLESLIQSDILLKLKV